MAKTFFPFDAGAGANVTEAQWTKMAQFWLGTGVLLGELNAFAVFADNTGMQVKVPSGRAWIKGHFFESDAQETLPITAANPANPRIDRVIIRLDWTANTIDLAVLAGTPAVAPAAPALTQSTSMWEVSLAQILVDAAAFSIAAGKVTDERTYASAVVIGFLALAGGTMTGPLTLGGDPTLPLHSVTKQYADALRAGLLVKDPVRATTTANIALTALQTIDGVVLVAGDRVLVKNQTTGSQNGIYVAAAGAWSRSTDADSNAEVKAGLYVMVTEGTTNGDSAFVLTTNDPLTLGTTALTFTQYSSLTQLTVGSGLIKSGNQISPDFSASGGNNGTGTKVARSDHSHTIRLTHSYAIPGDIALVSGSTNYVVPFNMPTLPAGQTATLKGVICYLESGTSATVKVARKPWGGAEADLAAPYAAIVVTTTEQEVTGDVALASKDRLRVIVTAINTAPKNLTFDFEIEYTHL